MRLFTFVKYLVLDKPPVKYTEDVHDIGVVEYDYYHTTVDGQEIYDMQKPITLIYKGKAMGLAGITQVSHLKIIDGDVLTLIDYDMLANFSDETYPQSITDFYTQEYLDYVDKNIIVEKLKFEKALGESEYGRITKD
jgi:hypothetical protein